MNKKTIYIIVAVLVIVIVIAGAGILLMNSNNPAPNPTPTPAVGIKDATSLKFSVSDSTGNYTYAAKNMGANMSLRLEILGSPSYVYVINSADKKAASNVTGTMAAEDYQTTFDMWLPVFQGYVAKLETWTSGDYTYNDASGKAVTISGIVVNPTLDDSLFATS